jgi:oligoendopeptidase F
MWLQYCNDPVEAIALYKEGLTLGNSKPLPQLFETSGLKFDFTAQMVGTLMKAVEDALDQHA